jgi:hypothetical protein
VKVEVGGTVTSIDQFTLSTIPLEQFFNDTPLGHATGFIWFANGRYFLVSNWHVFSMLDFFTGKNSHPYAAWPNILKAHFQVPGTYEKVICDLRIRGHDDRPLWFVRPPAARRVDIAVLPLDLQQKELGINLYPINVLASAKLRIEIGMEVFILGYPFAISPPAFPIWKRGSIASEPDLARLTTGYMYVDTASRPGMSGAPVIRRSWSNHMVEPGVLAMTDGPLNRFIGVYSGRVHTNYPYEAQIGLVWDGSYIDEIIQYDQTDR